MLRKVPYPQGNAAGPQHSSGVCLSCLTSQNTISYLKYAAFKDNTFEILPQLLRCTFLWRGRKKEVFSHIARTEHGCYEESKRERRDHRKSLQQSAWGRASPGLQRDIFKGSCTWVLWEWAGHKPFLWAATEPATHRWTSPLRTSGAWTKSMAKHRVRWNSSLSFSASWSLLLSAFPGNAPSGEFQDAMLPWLLFPGASPCQPPSATASPPAF